jgi:hypothetical protein
MSIGGAIWQRQEGKALIISASYEDENIINLTSPLPRRHHYTMHGGLMSVLRPIVIVVRVPGRCVDA